MKTIPVLLRGNLTEDLQYNFGTVYPITKGEWQVAIKHVAFEYSKNKVKTPVQRAIDSFLYLSCNYVEETFVYASEESSVKSSVLELLYVQLEAGKKQVISPPNRDFYHVGN